MEYLLRIISYYIIVFFKRLRGLRLRLYNWYTELYLMKKQVAFSPSELRLYGHTYFYIGEKSKLKIGKDFIIRFGPTAGIDVGVGSKIVIEDGASLIIGNYSGMTNTVIQCHNHVYIGNYVNIGAGCLIMDSNFHSTNWKDRADRRIDILRCKNAPVIIGDFVFIGTRCIICKGVKIGSRSIVAAGSVVIEDIGEGEVWGGSPARFIKKI